jgi:3',5'-cyclic AMP phosphodiesterase CpdA
MSRAAFALALACLAAARGADASTDRPLRGAGPPLAPAKAGGDLLFVVAGDNRPTQKGAPVPRTTRALFDEIGLLRPDLVLWTGDSIYGYGDSPAELGNEYATFLTLASLGKSPLFNTPGNHEIHREEGQPCGRQASEHEFEKRFGRLYGSFDAAGVHFIALDTSVPCGEDRIEGDQLDWLKRDLEANRNARAIFVFTHTEFFSSPFIDEDAAGSHAAVTNAEEIHDLFRRYPVRAVFSGHEHLYWREPAEDHDGIEYFVAGGGGAPLYAPADRGGFSHYLVVRVTDGGVSYDVVEPGRLYAESGPREKGIRRFWIVNSNDVELSLRGVSVSVPAALGPCSSLTAESALKKRDGTPVPVPVAISACATRAGRRELTLRMTAPRRVSVPVAVHRR